MAQDSSGNIWLGTIADGVYMYNGKTFRHYNTRNGLSSNFINYILIDVAGYSRGWYQLFDSGSK